MQYFVSRSDYFSIKCDENKMDTDLRDELLSDVGCPCCLKEHSKDLGPAQMIKVTDGVYMAFGYGLANSIMLEGTDGLVIVDTMDTLQNGQKVLEAFRQISVKPIQAIVLTHHHGDHIRGTKAFVKDKNNPPDIWAHELYTSEMSTLKKIGPLARARSIRQFGAFLGPALVSAGIGTKLDVFDKGAVSGHIMPTKIMKGNQQKISRPGMEELYLVHIPGETEDQIGVWWPEKKVFVCADDVYKSFPNLYAIRGTVSRSVLDWVESLNKMLELDIEHLVPCHTRPISGKDQVIDVLTVYRDAILYVHDETVRLMNQGMHPDDIADTVKLPARLAEHPYLIEYYGTVKWSVKAVFSSYVGWFSGDPVELSPLTPRQRAVHLLETVGGPETVLQQAEKALSSGNHQWALELATDVLRVHLSDSKAREVRTKALKGLAEKQISANGRNWYLACLLEDYENPSKANI